MFPRVFIAFLIAGLLTGPAATTGDEPAGAAPAAALEVRALIDAGKYGEAEGASRDLLRDLEAQVPGDPQAIARGLELLAESLWRGGKSKQPEALDSAERALALKEKTLGADHPELAASLQNIATVLRLRGEPGRSQALLERAIAIQERHLGPEHPDLIKILNSLGSLLAERADYEGSNAFYLRALALSERAQGPESRQVAVLLNNLASNHQERGAFTEAVPVHERAIAIMKAVHAGTSHPDLAHCLNAYANTLRNLGEYDRARRLHEEALAIREKALGLEHNSVAASLNNLALVLQDQGDPAGARPYLERAVAIWEKGLGPDHPLVAQGYNNLGALKSGLGDFDAARRHLDAALAIREKQLGPDHPLVAQTLRNLGKALVLLRDYPAAKPHLERAIVIWETALGADSPQVAMARQTLGQLLLETRDLEAARAQLEKALAIRERSLGPEHPLIGETLSALGDLNRAGGAYGRARDYDTRALAVLEAALGPGHPAVADSLTRLAATDYDLGRFDEARAEAAAGATSSQQFLRSTLAALSEREALLLFGRQRRPEVTLFSGLLADEVNRKSWLSACWAWTLGQRGLVLEEMAARRRAAHLGASPAVQAAWSRLNEARRLLAATWVRGVEEEDIGTYRERLDRATREKEAAEIEMARTSALYREQRQAWRATLTDVGAALPDGSALIETVRVPIRARGSRDEGLHDIALILKEDGTTGFVDLGRSGEIDDLVTAWRRVLDETAGGNGEGDGQARLLETGLRLRQKVWNPIAARIRGIGTIFLVPDGPLLQINMGALPAEDGTFLVEDGPKVHLIGAARDLIRVDRATGAPGGSRSRGMLLVGAPDFNAPVVTRIAGLEPSRREGLFRGPRTACGPVTGMEWPGLPEAAREIAQVGALFKKQEPLTVLSGATASEDRFKLEAPGKRILHLATHGYFLEERCTSILRENPLLLSGLVLAGANTPAGGNPEQGIDDGVLTAEEVAALDLRGVDLAVLSACDTGRGDVQVGEGVFGLRRSLELAGVRAIVMSVWPVPDREARRWMASFYESLLAGTSVPDASRHASLAALKRLRAAERPTHPYYWGGFVTAGDWRAAGAGRTRPPH